MAEQLSIFGPTKPSGKKVVNVASVPQRSPFRYPGGKTWMVPIVRKWLRQGPLVQELHEPFAGGGIVSLTAAFERLAEKISMVEMDEQVAAVWQVLIHGDHEWLAQKIFSFELTIENANVELQKPNKSINDIAFSTILKNRIFHGGILAKGSGMIKNGENGKGIRSRWYPKTLRDRMLAIGMIRDRISFETGDAFENINRRNKQPNTYFFIDPPYTKAGKRLYTHFELDHDELFRLCSEVKGKFLLTYDNTEEIRGLADQYNLPYRLIPMKTTHHIQKYEVMVSDNFEWWD